MINMRSSGLLHINAPEVAKTLTVGREAIVEVLRSLEDVGYDADTQSDFSVDRRRN